MAKIEATVGEFEERYLSSQKKTDAFINDFTLQDSSFSQRLVRALNNPGLSDHNNTHIQEVTKLTGFVIKGLGEERQKEIQPHLDSIALFAFIHDSAQLATLQRNLDDNRGDEGCPPILNAKKSHGLEAALMALAFVPGYAEANNISRQEARKICAKTAIMCIRHEDIYVFDQALRGNVLPTNPHDDQELADLFKTNTLDLMSISPKDITLLLRAQKIEGIDPFFQNEYAEELGKLAIDDTPLFQVDDGDKLKTRESLRVAAHVALAPDIIAMMAPAGDTLNRLLLTQYSQNRPIFIGNTDEVIRLIQNGDGNGFGADA